MPEYRRAHVPGGTYFFTVNTYRRQRVLVRDEIRVALQVGIERARTTLPFRVDAWVLLPDHLHCIWTLPQGDSNYPARWAIIKRHVSKCWIAFGEGQATVTESRAKRKETDLWQRRYWEHWIRDETDFRHHVDYVHWNPVKHGYVTQVRDWPYSTFHRYVRQGTYPIDWCGDRLREGAGDFGE